METKAVTIEDLEIGILRYTLEAEIYYSEDTDSGDYTPTSDWVVAGHQIIGEIHCLNSETGEESTVTDPIEIAMIEDWINWESELEKAF